MTKGIGWDIGIKNLAYCVLDSGVSSESPNAFKFNKVKMELTTQIQSDLMKGLFFKKNKNGLEVLFFK